MPREDVPEELVAAVETAREVFDQALEAEGDRSYAVGMLGGDVGVTDEERARWDAAPTFEDVARAVLSAVSEAGWEPRWNVGATADEYRTVLRDCQERDREFAEARAQSDALAEALERIGGLGGPLYKLNPNQGERPDPVAAAVDLREIVVEALRAYRSSQESS